MSILMLSLYNLDVYHGYALHSSSALTDDAQYWAVSWYWQEPCDNQGESYHYWILSDISDPDMWYSARNFFSRGIRTVQLMGPEHCRSRACCFHNLVSV